MKLLAKFKEFSLKDQFYRFMCRTNYSPMLIIRCDIFLKEYPLHKLNYPLIALTIGHRQRNEWGLFRHS